MTFTYKVESENKVFEVTVKADNMTNADQLMEEIISGHCYKYDIK